MRKTLIGLLLIVCLVVGLLPITALADNTAKILILGTEELTVTEGGAAVYLKNKEFDAANKADGSTTFKAWTQEAGTADNWNVKFEWPTGGIPTITLKDAKMDYYDNETETYAYINKGGSLVSTDNRTTQDLEGRTNLGTDQNPLIAAILPVSGYNIDLKIILKGENLIETGSGFVVGNPSAKANAAEKAAETYTNTYFKNLTFVGDGENKTTSSGGLGIFTRSGYDLSFENVNLTMSTKVMGSNAIPIHVTKGNLTITGGHLNIKNPNNVAITCRDGGNIVINGDITVNHALTSTAGAGSIYSKNGTITINGGNIVGTSRNAPILNSGVDLIINGGNLKLTSAYYAVLTDKQAPIHINGGTLEIMAERAFRYAPILGSNVKGFAGGSAESADVYDISNKNIHSKPWVLLSDQPLDIPTEPTDPSVPIILPTSQPTTAPTQTPATNPTLAPTDPSTAPTQAPSGDDTKPSGSAATDPTSEAKPGETKPGETKPADDKGNDEDGGSNTVIIIVAAVLVLGTAAAIVFIIKKRKSA